jgi:hypothetical protein
MRSAGNFNSEWGYLAPAPSFMRTARVVLVATAIGATAGAAVVLSLIDRPATDRDKTASVAAHAIVTSAQAAPATTVASGSSASAALAAPVKVTTAAPPAVASTAQALPAAPIAPKFVPAGPSPVAPQVAVQPPPPAMQSSDPPQSRVVTQSAPAVPPPAAAISPSVSESSGNTGGDASPPPKPATGMAALSDTLPASEAAPAGVSDQALMPPQTVPPDKKQKHHGTYASSKYEPTPGLGGVLRRLFSAHPGNSYYPNR